MAEPTSHESRIVIVGADHKSSTMVLRDRLFMREAVLPAFYERLRLAGFAEAMVLSTIDRTEVLAVPGETEDPIDEIRRLLAAHAGIGRNDVAAETYALAGPDAVKHLFAVTTALDSLVVGDARVLDTVRGARLYAERRGAIGLRLAPLLERAVALAEEIDKETELMRRPSSIPAAAVHTARDLHGDLARCRALLIGIGEMGELLASSLVSAGLAHLEVTHPNASRAESAAQSLNCHAGDYADLGRLLQTADIVLTALNTRRYVLDRDSMRRALAARRRKPILVVDTGVPGDVDPAVADVEDVFLYTLHDLERVTRSGTRGYEKAASRAWDMVSQVASEYAEQSEAAADEVVGDAVENLRRESLRLAGGDADKATRFLVARLLRLKRDG